MIKKIVKKSKYLFSLALSLREFGLKQDVSKLSAKQRQYLDELNKYGVIAIPNFFTEKECAKMKNVFDSLDDKYAKYYDNDKRIYGIDKLSDLHSKVFHNNEMFKRIGEAYMGDELLLQTTMGAKISFDVNYEKHGSGGSWHRDSFSRQFKAITYLNDVSMQNGPFMYIKGSHKMKNIKKVLFELKEHVPASNFRYTDEEVEKIKDILDEDISYFTAPKGTLILADVRGLHTGMPLKEDGERYAVFNYYIAKSFHQPNNNIEKLAEENN